jgi:hypothetical protein
LESVTCSRRDTLVSFVELHAARKWRKFVYEKRSQPSRAARPNPYGRGYNCTSGIGKSLRLSVASTH